MAQRVPWCRWLVLFLPALSASCTARHADQAAKPADPVTSAESGWIALFDGATLAGWKECGFGGGGAIGVDEGRMILEQGSPMTGLRYVGSDAPSGDYELELDAARLAGTDFFCGLTFAVGDRSLTLVLGGWGGTLCGLSCLDGRDASMNSTCCYRRFERGRAVHVRLRVERAHVQAWLDDTPLVDVDTSGHVLSLRTEVERCAPLGISTYATIGAISGLRWRRLRAASRRRRPRRAVPRRAGSAGT
jgi:hypothetical protein